MTQVAILGAGQASVTVTPSGDATGATDAAEIQNAINTLRGVGGLVFLKGSQFYVNATILLYPGICLAGQGPLGVSTPVAGCSVITGVAALNAPIVQMQLDPNNTGWASFPVLRDLTLNGVLANGSQHGVSVSN